MPTYEYVCTECGTPLEVVQSFADDPLVECPTCGGRLRKVFSAVGVVFKGSGFYRNDSRSEKSAVIAGAKSSGDGKSAGDGKPSSDSSSSKESKPSAAKQGESASGSKDSSTSSPSTSTSSGSSGQGSSASSSSKSGSPKN